MHFGEYVKKLRTEMKLSQRDLSKKSGISNVEISRLESGERQKPSPQIIKAIAPYLGISSEELMMQAGYIDHVIDRDKYEEESIALFDTFQKAKRIAEIDDELIGIILQIAEKFPEEDIKSMKNILHSFLDDRVPDTDKQTMLKIFERFTGV